MDANWRLVAYSDADMHKDGIGPVWVIFRGEYWTKEWWKGARFMFPITIFNGGDTCNLNGHNESDRNSFKPGTKQVSGPGTNSLDIIYVSDMNERKRS
jgi:hypothetical protein